MTAKTIDAPPGAVGCGRLWLQRGGRGGALNERPRGGRNLPSARIPRGR